MIKFTFKVGLATAAVYYVKEQGIWKQSNESIKTFQKIKDAASPYVQEVTNQIPYELPKLPESDVMSSIIKESWNKGVLVTFKFLADLPNTAGVLTAKGLDSMKKNEEIKKLIETFS